jgi:hypothetical protein
LRCLAAALALVAAMGYGLAPSAASADPSDVIRADQFVRVGSDRVIHLIETYSAAAISRASHRAVLMFPGPVSNARLLDIPVNGYDAGAILAEHGFFAYAPKECGSQPVSLCQQSSLYVTELERREIRRAVSDIVDWLFWFQPSGSD